MGPSAQRAVRPGLRHREATGDEGGQGLCFPICLCALAVGRGPRSFDIAFRPSGSVNPGGVGAMGEMSSACGGASCSDLTRGGVPKQTSLGPYCVRPARAVIQGIYRLHAVARVGLLVVCS